MMSRRTGLAALALVVTGSLFGGWDPVPVPESNLPVLSMGAVEAAPAYVPRSINKVEGVLGTLGDPDGFTDGPGGDPDGGSPPDSTAGSSGQERQNTRGLGRVALSLLEFAARLF
jgi:hypothetical protein